MTGGRDARESCKKQDSDVLYFIISHILLAMVSHGLQTPESCRRCKKTRNCKLSFLNVKDNAIGSVILFKNPATCRMDDRFYFTGHDLVTDATKALTLLYPVQTCPHVLQSPSAIAPIVDINSYSFPHRPDFFRLAIFFFRFFFESRRASARRSAASSISCSCELR